MPIEIDSWGQETTAATAAAVEALDGAILAYCGMRTDIGDRMKTVFEADPEMPMALAAKGAFLKMFATEKMDAAAAKTAEQLRERLGQGDGTPRERGHLEALAVWVAGDLEGACRAWERLTIEHPRDLLALKLTQLNRFYLGDPAGMRGSIARALHAWDEDAPGYGYLLGSYAFALEEDGAYHEAELKGRAAIEIDRTDVWAAHAVAHVMEMQGRVDQGLGWLDHLKTAWDGVHNFKHHAHWHRALFALELGRRDQALEIYDQDVWTEIAGDYLDVSNAASLLWRLEEEGVDVGDRWTPIADVAAERAEERALVFATGHFALALAADGRDADLARLKQAQESHGGVADDTFAQVWEACGRALVGAAEAVRTGRPGRAVDLLTPVRDRVRLIGGSWAQRDLFDRMLIEAALADERRPLARALLSERLERRPGNRFGRDRLTRLEA